MVYLIKGIGGAYDEQWHWVVMAFYVRGMAEEYMQKLQDSLGVLRKDDAKWSPESITIWNAALAAHQKVDPKADSCYPYSIQYSIEEVEIG